jgi:hypothetical protein
MDFVVAVRVLSDSGCIEESYRPVRLRLCIVILSLLSKDFLEHLPFKSLNLNTLTRGQISILPYEISTIVLLPILLPLHECPGPAHCQPRYHIHRSIPLLLFQSPVKYRRCQIKTPAGGAHDWILRLQKEEKNIHELLLQLCLVVVADPPDLEYGRQEVGWAIYVNICPTNTTWHSPSLSEYMWQPKAMMAIEIDLLHVPNGLQARYTLSCVLCCITI